MSAYIVERDHIIYLVDAARESGAYGSTFRWYTGERPNYERHELPRDDNERAAEVANMLWRENIKSVSHRYDDRTSATLPGTKDNRHITARDFAGVRWMSFNPVQVIKACHCLDYQSCEHDEWPTSEAYAFLEALKANQCHRLPGYDSAEWGVPKRYENAHNVVKLSDLFSK
jgi:hypothetical protein